jgi:hypothetical protein
MLIVLLLAPLVATKEDNKQKLILPGGGVAAQVALTSSDRECEDLDFVFL